MIKVRCKCGSEDFTAQVSGTARVFLTESTFQGKKLVDTDNDQIAIDSIICDQCDKEYSVSEFSSLEEKEGQSNE